VDEEMWQGRCEREDVGYKKEQEMCRRGWKGKYVDEEMW